MKTWVKIVLVCLLLGILAVVGASFAIYKWVVGAVREADTLVPAAQRDGREFAKHATQDGCVDEAATRASACASLGCEVAEKSFLQSCFAAATPDPKACDGVPSPDKLVESAKWGIKECQRRGHPGDQRCTRLLQTLQPLCTGGTGASTRDGG
jgi:hypothetical protein